MKPWREVAIPREDVLKGTFQEAEFAVDLSLVQKGDAASVYQDPIEFFNATYLTEGMKQLLGNVLRRLHGINGDPVIQLRTAFGGGKTHTLLAVYHLATAECSPSKLRGLSEILEKNGIRTLPKAKVAILDGNSLAPNESQQRKNCSVHTLWGELAWQLGGKSFYEMLAKSDSSGTSPGKELLCQMLQKCGPCVILIDEIVAYLRQFESGKTYLGGTFGSVLSFVQALTEAAKSVPNCAILVSLPESNLELGGTRGQQALPSLEKYFGRVQALWSPISTEEAFEIVRRRLFREITDRSSVESVCKAFSESYSIQKDDFPDEPSNTPYLERLLSAYPIHPELFDRLYKEWSTIESFQRTRGVLKLMARVVHRLWTDGNGDLLIQPGSIPLHDSDVRTEWVHYLAKGWDPVIEKEIDDMGSESWAIDSDPRFGSCQAARRVARTLFIATAPSYKNQMNRGIDLKQILLGSFWPSQNLSTFKDALLKLSDRLHYLHGVKGRYWLDTTPNLKREMEQRRSQFSEVSSTIATLLKKELSRGIFEGVHIFAESADIPDDDALRIVVLPIGFEYSQKQKERSRAEIKAEEILLKRGETPRSCRNRLLFLAPEIEFGKRLQDQIRTVLSWESILDDSRNKILNLDSYQLDDAKVQYEKAKKLLEQLIRETYRFLLVPKQVLEKGIPKRDIDWDVNTLSSNASLKTEIESRLRSSESVIFAWHPVHLIRYLEEFYWKKGDSVSPEKLWEDFTRTLYYPRLVSERTLKETIYSGDAPLHFALISSNGSTKLAKLEDPPKPVKPTRPPGPDHPKTNPKVFRAAVSIKEPEIARKKFGEIYEDILSRINEKHDAKLSIRIAIEASTPQGFDESLQRTLRENCNSLGFDEAEFESH